MLNTVDYIILGVVLVFGIWGAIKGLIEEVARKFGYFAGLLVALMFTKALEGVFVSSLEWPLWLSAAVSYIVLFLAGYILIKILGNILQNIFEEAHLTALDNCLGLLLGLFEGIVIVGLVEILLSHQSIINLQSYFDQSSISNSVIVPVFDWVTTIVHKVF